jgi:hypothetical protein
MTKENATGTASDESIRAYLKETLEHLLAAGHSAHDLVELALDKFGRRIIPHLKELQEDILQSRVKIHNLAGSAKIAVFGMQVSPEQREQMIRDAAYLRAETRNFAGGGQEVDWLSAEQEVDGLLARQNGLLEKGRKNIESVSEIAKSELTEVKGVVRHWLKARGEPVKKAG